MSDQTQLQCCECGMLFWVPNYYYMMRKGDGKSFWCPAGHSQHFTESDLTKARRELDQLRVRLASTTEDRDRQRSRRLDAEKSAASYRGHVTRLKNRREQKS